jgi:hypothetical protein
MDTTIMSAGEPAPHQEETKIQRENSKRTEVEYNNEVMIRSLTDLMVMPMGMIQPQERAFAADLLQQVVHAAGDSAKRAISERIAGLSDAPASLVRWMLNDFDDDVLEPLLRRGTCITDNDLLTLVRAASPERLKAIAARIHLPCVVSAALAETGDIPAIRELLINPAAKIDEPTLMLLTHLAVCEPDIRDPLVMRPEMTPSCGLLLFWCLGPRQRAHVFRRFLTDCQVLPQVFVMAKPGGDLITGALRCADAQSSENVDGHKEPVKSNGRAMVAELMAAIEVADEVSTAAILHTLGLANMAAAERIAGDLGGEPLAAACKVAGASRFSFQSAAASWRSLRPIEGDDVADLQIIFDKLSFKQARMALTYWNWQTSDSGPYTAIGHAFTELTRSAA